MSDFHFPMNTEVLLASDFEPSNEDESFVQRYSCTGRITDLSHNEDKYFVTFDDTSTEDEGDIGFWVDVDQVELA